MVTCEVAQCAEQDGIIGIRDEVNLVLAISRSLIYIKNSRGRSIDP